MSSQWDDDNERTTSRHNRTPTDMDHTVGQLMVESLNHRRRIEVAESRLEVLETRIRILVSKTQDSLSPPTGSEPPGGRASLFILAKKTVKATLVVIIATIAALKELGYLK